MERKIEKLGILNRKFANLDDAHNRCIAYREGIIANQNMTIKDMNAIIAAMIRKNGKAVILTKEEVQCARKLIVTVREIDTFAIKLNAVEMKAENR